MFGGLIQGSMNDVTVGTRPVLLMLVLSAVFNVRTASPEDPWFCQVFNLGRTLFHEMRQM